jgi:hypothetical protein
LELVSKGDIIAVSMLFPQRSFILTVSPLFQSEILGRNMILLTKSYIETIINEVEKGITLANIGEGYSDKITKPIMDELKPNIFNYMFLPSTTKRDAWRTEMVTFNSYLGVTPQERMKRSLQYGLVETDTCKNVYYLLWDTDKTWSKGILDNDGNIICYKHVYDNKSISALSIKEIIYFNKDEYEKDTMDYVKNWELVVDTPTDEWKLDKEMKEVTYNAKTMMDCMILLDIGLENSAQMMLCTSRLKDRDYLLSIRNGEQNFKDIMYDISIKLSHLKDLFKNDNRSLYLSEILKNHIILTFRNFDPLTNNK